MSDPSIKGGAPATAAEITAITGPLEPAVVTAILATGASAAEVMAAFFHFNASENQDRRTSPALDGPARQVVDILNSEYEPPDEP